jgi:hypothetical protein
MSRIKILILLFTTISFIAYGQKTPKKINLYYVGGVWYSSPAKKQTINDSHNFDKISTIKNKKDKDSLLSMFNNLREINNDSCLISNGIKLRVEFVFKDSVKNYYFYNEDFLESDSKCYFSDFTILLYLWDNFLPEHMKTIVRTKYGFLYSPYFPIIENKRWKIN